MAKFILKESINDDTVLGQYIKDRSFISVIRGPWAAVRPMDQRSE